jgi:uncharacterized membrane protein YtjA (UPF0391 family)
MVDCGGSHGDDMGFDGASLAAPQPYEGVKREFLRSVSGSLRVRVETDGREPPESDGRIPPPEGGGGGQFLSAAVALFVVALIAAGLGFGGIAGISIEVARILVLVFLVLAVVALVL